MVAALDPFAETEAKKERLQVVETDSSIGGASQQSQ